MNVRIEQKEEFDIYGMERIVKNGIFYSKSVPNFWKENHKNGNYEKLYRSLGKESQTEVGRGGFERCAIGGISGYRETAKNTHPYMIFAERKEGCKTDGFLMVRVPASNWAIFRSDESEQCAAGLGGLFKQAYGEWLPTSGYDVASDVNIEAYYSDGNGKYFEEVWIPVRKLND